MKRLQLPSPSLVISEITVQHRVWSMWTCSVLAAVRLRSHVGRLSTTATTAVQYWGTTQYCSTAGRSSCWSHFEVQSLLQPHMVTYSHWGGGRRTHRVYFKCQYVKYLYFTQGITDTWSIISSLSFFFTKLSTCTPLEYFHFLLLYTSTPIHWWDDFSYIFKWIDFIISQIQTVTVMISWLTRL